MTEQATVDGIPLARGGLPLLGHALPLLRDPLTFVKSLPAYGDLVRIRIATVQVIVVCSPDLTRQVLRNDRVFDKDGPLFERAREVFGNGLASCRHEHHRRQRRLTQPAFHPHRLPGYSQRMTAQARAAADGWRDGQIIDVPAETYALSMRTVVETMFSDALAPEVVHRAVDDLTIVFGGIFRRMLMPPLVNRLPTPSNRTYHRARARLFRTIGDIIADRRASGEDQGDLLSALLTARDSGDDGDGQGLSDLEISDQVVTFFAAGSDTTAGILAWALYLLALHPDVEKRVHEEVDTVLAGAPATLEQLPRLEVTERVISETLRLYPQGWFFTRKTNADTHLGGHPLPAGTTLAYSPYLMHHRGDLYPDAERFDPDRWDQHHPKPSRDAYIPFAAGARKCIGDRFGTIEGIIALATIAARWRLEPVSTRPVRPGLGITLGPHDLKMRVIARNRP